MLYVGGGNMKNRVAASAEFKSDVWNEHSLNNPYRDVTLQPQVSWQRRGPWC